MEWIYKKLLVYLGSFLCFFPICKCQEITWQAGFHSFFDNREYYNDYAQPGTIFGARNYAMAGLAVDSHICFQTGVNMLYEFGSHSDPIHFDPILYFHFQKKAIDLYTGSFPRINIIQLPYLLQSDTFMYYRPNIEGIYLCLQKTWGYHSLWIDWTSRQMKESQEIFLIGGTGMLKKGVGFYRHDFIMEHYSHTSSGDPDEHIRDNGGYITGLGLDLSHKILFDSLSLYSAFAFSYYRIRNVYPFKKYGGSYTKLDIQYRFIGLEYIIYVGDGQVQTVGDPMYEAEFYSRLDLFLLLFRKSPVKAKVQFSLHQIDNVYDVSQLLSVYLTLGGSRKICTDQ